MFGYLTFSFFKHALIAHFENTSKKLMTLHIYFHIISTNFVKSVFGNSFDNDGNDNGGIEAVEK